MNATDLMIGDWVLMRGAPVQVRGIGVNTIRYSDMLITEPLENIEPIPLTPEILEKNWFLVGYKQGSRTYYHIGWDFYLDLDGGEILLKIRRDCDFTFFGIISCKYVHELQHALKLCGIEKEVVI